MGGCEAGLGGRNVVPRTHAARPPPGAERVSQRPRVPRPENVALAPAAAASVTNTALHAVNVGLDPRGEASVTKTAPPKGRHGRSAPTRPAKHASATRQRPSRALSSADPINARYSTEH